MKTDHRIEIIRAYLAARLDGQPGPPATSEAFEELAQVVGLAVDEDSEAAMALLGRYALAALVDHLRSSVGAARLLEKVSERPFDPDG